MNQGLDPKRFGLGRQVELSRRLDVKHRHRHARAGGLDTFGVWGGPGRAFKGRNLRGQATFVENGKVDGDVGV